MGWPEITRLLLRALGALFVAVAAYDLSIQLYTISSFDFIRHQVGESDSVHSGLLLLYFLPRAIFLALGLALLFLAPRLVQRFSHLPAIEQNELNLRAIENTLVAVLGLYFLADGMVLLARLAFDIAFFAFAPQASRSVGSELFAIGAKFAIGWILILRNQGVAALRHHLNDRIQRLRRWKPE